MQELLGVRELLLPGHSLAKQVEDHAARWLTSDGDLDKDLRRGCRCHLDGGACNGALWDATDHQGGREWQQSYSRDQREPRHPKLQNYFSYSSSSVQ